jgi:hypothetical protein
MSKIGNEAVVIVAPTRDSLLFAMPLMNALMICVNFTKPRPPEIVAAGEFDSLPRQSATAASVLHCSPK